MKGEGLQGEGLGGWATSGISLSHWAAACGSGARAPLRVSSCSGLWLRPQGGWEGPRSRCLLKRTF